MQAAELKILWQQDRIPYRVYNEQLYKETYKEYNPRTKKSKSFRPITGDYRDDTEDHYKLKKRLWKLKYKMKGHICQEWVDDAYAFIRWSLHNGYPEKKWLYRKDLQKDYSPENCYWDENRGFRDINRTKKRKSTRVKFTPIEKALRKRIARMNCHWFVCKAWTTNYQAFVDWSLNNGYAPGKDLRRIDTSKSFGPSNAIWVDRRKKNEYFN